MSRWHALAAVALVWPASALAHGEGGARLTERAFTINPWLIGALLVACTLYVRGQQVRKVKRPFGGGHTLEQSAFALGILTLALALLSPLDALSDLSFAAHMLQHELLMLLAAPALVLARPLPVYLQSLPTAVRDRAAACLRNRAAVVLFRIFTAPWVALFVHGAVRWVWHLPFLFQAALSDEWVHGAQHASFFVTALLFWWGLLQGRSGRAGYGLAALFVLLTAIHTGALGALFSFSERVWYPTYDARLEARGYDALEDQQLAGLIMWVGAFVWLLFLALALLFAWLGEARRRAARSSVARLVGSEGHPLSSLALP